MNFTNVKILFVILFFLLMFVPQLSSIEASEPKFASIGYNPYRSIDGPNGIPPSENQIEEDMYNLQFITESIRLFGSPLQQELIIIKAKENNIGVHLSFYVDQNESKVERDLEKIKRIVKQHDNIESIIIEKSKRGPDFPLSDVADYLDILKKETRDIDITFAAGIAVWLENKILVEKVDYILLQSFPYWEGTSTDKSLKIAIDNKVILENKFKSKKVILETGWPSDGQNIDCAVPSNSEQAKYITELADKVDGSEFIIFIAFSEPWKSPFKTNIEPDKAKCSIVHNDKFSENAENHWGLFSVHREINGELYQKYLHKFVESTAESKIEVRQTSDQCELLFEVNPDTVIENLDKQALQIDLGAKNQESRQINVFHKTTLESLSHLQTQPPVILYFKSNDVNLFEDVVIGINCGDITELKNLGIPTGTDVDVNNKDLEIKADVIPSFFANCIAGESCQETDVQKECIGDRIMINGRCQHDDDEINTEIEKGPEPISNEIIVAIITASAIVIASALTVFVRKKN